jgi:hypothetical protein
MYRAFYFSRTAPNPAGGKDFSWYQVVKQLRPGVECVLLDFIGNQVIAWQIARARNLDV